jgi:DTW domain-containing protein YfiP
LPQRPQRRVEDTRTCDAKLPKRRTTREVQESLSAQERFFVVGEEALARRAVEVDALQRCPDCWHNRNQHCGGNRCICAQLPDLSLSVNVRVLVYMHYLEWMNSGNSGKLLLKCLPKQSAQLFLYGRRQDDERLQALIATDPGHTALLFPSPDAVTLGDFVATAASNAVDGTAAKQDRQPQMLTLVVLDATYRKAKNMAKHFQRCIDGTGRVRCV